MIKILFFIETLSGGGAEKVLQNLVNNMDNEKFDITVQTVWKENPDKYLNKNINYKYIYPCYSRLLTLNVVPQRLFQHQQIKKLKKSPGFIAIYLKKSEI